MEYLLILLGAIAAGFGGAGIMMAVNRLTGRRLPGWSSLVAAGAAMLGMTLYLEYDWFDRRSAQLPEGIEVVWNNAERQAWRPWTYVFPLTTRFIAMDVEHVGTNETQPDLRLVEMMFVQRWTRDRLSRAVFDCAANRSAQVGLDTNFGPDGTVEGVDWDPVGPEDPVKLRACREGNSDAGDSQEDRSG
ncbi:MAG: hypothetical protein NXH97_17530 [Rhodobacteraceae bacterium]|nr:hypothetical protein [Paracoccaceae bacterium]